MSSCVENRHRVVPNVNAPAVQIDLDQRFQTLHFVEVLSHIILKSVTLFIQTVLRKHVQKLQKENNAVDRIGLRQFQVIDQGSYTDPTRHQLNKHGIYALQMRSSKTSRDHLHDDSNDVVKHGGIHKQKCGVYQRVQTLALFQITRESNYIRVLRHQYPCLSSCHDGGSKAVFVTPLPPYPHDRHS